MTLHVAVSERARARYLLELLEEARADIRRMELVRLLERERSLQQRLNARAAEQARLLNRKPLPATAVAKEIAAIGAGCGEIPHPIGLAAHDTRL